MWETTAGEYTIDLEQFITNLQLSIKSFAAAMEIQVTSVLENPIENVFIDKKTLLENHKDFLAEVRSYENVLSFTLEQNDWEEVLEK